MIIVAYYRRSTPHFATHVDVFYNVSERDSVLLGEGADSRLIILC